MCRAGAVRGPVQEVIFGPSATSRSSCQQPGGQTFLEACATIAMRRGSVRALPDDDEASRERDARPDRALEAPPTDGAVELQGFNLPQPAHQSRAASSKYSTAAERVLYGPRRKECLADRRARQTKRAEPTALATEIVCILRYKYHAVAATGIASKSAADEFTEHAEDEEKHAKWISERINQLGGKPNFNPAELTARSATEYVEGENLVDMIRENLVAERIAIEHYRDLIRFFADKDPTSRHMMELILTDEEEHANDMHDLLVAHEGLPMLAR